MSDKTNTTPEQKSQPPAEKSNGLFGNLECKTWGVQNIEKAYSRAGASNNHTPGSASKLGSQDQAGNVQQHQGVGSAKFAEGISDQRHEVG